MSLSTGHYQLASALKALTVHWEEACQHWRDAVRRDFAEHHWGEVEYRIPNVLTAMDRLDQVLNQAKQECQ